MKTYYLAQPTDAERSSMIQLKPKLPLLSIAAVGYFLGDTKAVLNGCQDQWTLQSAVTMPRLFQITVCVDVHVVVPGAWVAFLYTSVRGPNPDLGLEGDATAVYGWLLQVRHRFPLQLAPMQWHRVCLRRDAEGNTFSLEVTLCSVMLYRSAACNHPAIHSMRSISQQSIS